MSIFKVKQLWSNEKLQSEEYDEGIQNSHCVKVDKFNSHNDSDCIISGEGRHLKIYKPNIEHIQSQVILESEQADVILHIETGKFVVDSCDRQILVLHPQSYVTYFLEKREGHVDVGDQNYLRPILKHSFTRKAYSVIVGPFGITKSRDLICVQALDGTLSFFDQDIFLFMCLLNDVIIPGPVAYVTSSDLFIICKSTWVMEIYSFQQLQELSELSSRPNKKTVPQWTYNPGEEISAVQVIRTSSNFSSIIALGERYLYCFQDNGLMKYMLRFDFMPICFHAYLIGWYYEPNSRLVVMVVSDDSKLYIFEETTLLWSCDLLHKTISISRCFLKNLSGGLVTFSTKGIINVSYLGTEPDLNSTIVPLNAVPEVEDIQTELEIVEEAIEKIMGDEDAFQQSSSDQLVKINIAFGKPIESYNEQHVFNQKIPNCPLIITLTCEDPKRIHCIQITYDCSPPFSVNDSTICLDDINGTEIVETGIVLSSDMDISNATINILITITECSGIINVLTNTVVLPISLYAHVIHIETDNQFKVYLTTNNGCKNLDAILEEFSDQNTSSNYLTFAYKNTHKTVTCKVMTEQYVIEANDCIEIFPILNYFLHRLHAYYTHKGVHDFHIDFETNSEGLKYMIHTFLKCIETHAKERLLLNNLETELNVLQSQFTLIQKKLLVQYGSLPPGNCDALEFLMRETHTTIISTAQNILANKENVIRASCELSSVGHLILCVLKHSNVEDGKIEILEETLSLETFHEDIQDWEESVAQASSFILNTILKKAKDKERLAPVTEQDILSHVNLKRFLKQIKLILEIMFLEDSGNERVEENITRIEEFVEVI